MAKGLDCKIRIWEFGWQGQMIWEEYTNQDMIEQFYALQKHD
jgi:hypothetical protein